MAAAAFSLEDKDLLDIALRDSNRYDQAAEAASSVLGPEAVGEMIDAYLTASMRNRDANGRYDQTAIERSSALRDRIGHTPRSSLVAAIGARADVVTSEQIALLASLMYRDTFGDKERGRPFNEESLIAVGALAQKWGEQLLALESATRWQKSSIATLIQHAPSVILLPILKRLLDDNLNRYRQFHEAAKASGFRDHMAMQEVRQAHTHEYQRAFIAINAPETDAMMVEYLTDEYFGELAATVVAVHWSEANEPKDGNKVIIGRDFSHVEARRARHAANPAESCAAADLIFTAIDELLAGESEDIQKTLAVALGIIGTRLPHGERTGTIQKLLRLAHNRSRANLLFSMAQSGEGIDIKLVADGIAEIFEAAKTQPWMLQGSDALQLREWLSMLPFAAPLSEIPGIVRALP